MNVWLTKGAPHWLALVLALSGCGEKLEPAAALPLSDGCPAEEVTFQNPIHSIFKAHCTNCHSSTLASIAARKGAPLGVNYDRFEDAVKHLNAALAEISEGTMPPGGPPVPLAKQHLIECWKQRGHPQ